MPPRRSNDETAELAALIAQQLAAVIPGIITQLTAASGSSGNGTNNLGGGGNVHTSTFKQFNNAKPPKFAGTEGATGLLQWLESIEDILDNTECPEALKVKMAASAFSKRALTWWNVEKRTRGREAALAMPWNDFKTLIVEQFCPKNELKNLEAELWELKQEGGDNRSYITRFHELCILVPHMVTPLSRQIDRFIGGLPIQIRGTVMGSNPTTLDAAIHLSASLTDDLVRAGVLTRKGEKQAQTEEAEESEPQFKKHKTTEYPADAPVIDAIPIRSQVQPPSGKFYRGSFPLCTQCNYHHDSNQPCRQCTRCARSGHTATLCHTRTSAVDPAILEGRTCFECGSADHLKIRCPKLASNRGARGSM